MGCLYGVPLPLENNLFDGKIAYVVIASKFSCYFVVRSAYMFIFLFCGASNKIQMMQFWTQNSPRYGKLNRIFFLICPSFITAANTKIFHKQSYVSVPRLKHASLCCHDSFVFNFVLDYLSRHALSYILHRKSKMIYFCICHMRIINEITVLLTHDLLISYFSFSARKLSITFSRRGDISQISSC